MPNKSEIAKEALLLADNTLRELEISEIPLASIALKCSRLARLMNDFEMQQIMLYEASGYPTEPTGVPAKVWALASKAERVYKKKEKNETKEYAHLKSIEQIEIELQTAKERLKVAQDPNVSVSSANPNQYVSTNLGNTMERYTISETINECSKFIAQRKAYIYEFLCNAYYELRYSDVTGDSFSRIRSLVDTNLVNLVPNALQKFTAIYDNLESDNTEDWSNAVHSCRRVLQDLADVLYPPTEDKIIQIGGKDKALKLGADAYINRLIAYAEVHSDSERYEEIVGSHMRFLGERLDSIFRAAQKGSHAEITTKGEADRYVVYTYMIVGDLLALNSQVQSQPSKA
jgi:hypothetical protein